MKLSLAWIFDHIDANWEDQDVELIVSKFNAITAEIEHTYPLFFETEKFFLAKVTAQTASSVTLAIPELEQSITLPSRTSTVDLISKEIANPVFMVKKEGSHFSWASLADFYVEKEGLVPALDANDHDLLGHWRKHFEERDVILEVDNKSITHRPDMWGHRGFAREIAAFLHLPFIHEDEFLVTHKILSFDTTTSQKTSTTPFVIENKVPGACLRFTGFYLSSIENKPTPLLVASRLLKIGLRPVNAIIDLTNYLTADWGQPVHAYDAQKIADQRLIIRMANEKEKLLLLDNNNLELTPDDIVIADAKKALCLGGIKGGMNDSIATTTTAVVLEAANFDPGFVRKSALRHKTRTDSSARFEKTLDPELAGQAAQRFLKLLKTFNIHAQHADEIISLGVRAKETIIEVSHAFLEQRSGLTLTENDIIEPLTRLGFKVLKSFADRQKQAALYIVSVPTARSSKDVKIKEDILEEVIRCYGFEKIPLTSPQITRIPFMLEPTLRLRHTKRFLAHSAMMFEQQNYSFSDEYFLRQLGLEEQKTISIINPVSENFYRLATSLIPGLLKNIHENHVQRESLRFFECGRVWCHDTSTTTEKKSISGIFCEKRKPVDFYACKQYLVDLFKMLGFNVQYLTWKKCTTPPAPWYQPYQTAQLYYHDMRVGVAGIVNTALLAKIDLLPESDAFAFELDGEFLLHAPTAQKRYHESSKFQDTYFDLSVLTPLAVTTESIEHMLHKVEGRVKKVELIDFFEKEDWHDVRSLTFRVWISDFEKTLEKEDIEHVWRQAVETLALAGVQLRA